MKPYTQTSHPQQLQLLKVTNWLARKLDKCGVKLEINYPYNSKHEKWNYHAWIRVVNSFISHYCISITLFLTANRDTLHVQLRNIYCPACRTYLIATRFWVVVICPIIKCLIVLEFAFILFDLCLFITIFNSILNYVPIVTFWIFTYHKICILLIIFCFIWNYWIIYFLTCLEVFWRVVSYLVSVCCGIG